MRMAMHPSRQAEPEHEADEVRRNRNWRERETRGNGGDGSDDSDDQERCCMTLRHGRSHEIGPVKLIAVVSLSF